MAVALKLYIFDTMLVKPKCVWEAVDVFDLQNFYQVLSGFINMVSNMHRFSAVANHADFYQMQHPEVETYPKKHDFVFDKI